MARRFMSTSNVASASERIFTVYGKHKGTPLGKIPDGYLKSLLKKPIWATSAEEVLQEREEMRMRLQKQETSSDGSLKSPLVFSIDEISPLPTYGRRSHVIPLKMEEDLSEEEEEDEDREEEVEENAAHVGKGRRPRRTLAMAIAEKKKKVSAAVEEFVPTQQDTRIGHPINSMKEVASAPATLVFTDEEDDDEDEEEDEEDEDEEEEDDDEEEEEEEEDDEDEEEMEEDAEFNEMMENDDEDIFKMKQEIWNRDDESVEQLWGLDEKQIESALKKQQKQQQPNEISKQLCRWDESNNQLWLQEEKTEKRISSKQEEEEEDDQLVFKDKHEEKLEGLRMVVSELENMRAKIGVLNYASILRWCGDMKALSEGERVHKLMMRTGIVLDRYARNELIDMYGKCGDVNAARLLFEKMKQKNVFSWSNMITAYAKNGECEEAVRMFYLMDVEGERADPMAFSCVLNACAVGKAVDVGKMIHQEIIQRGFCKKPTIEAALLDMYCSFGDVDEARDLFGKMSSKAKDLESWNSMIAALARSGLGQEALEYFRRMEVEGIRADEGSYGGALAACEILGATELAQTLRFRLRRHWRAHPY